MKKIILTMAVWFGSLSSWAGLSARVPLYQPPKVDVAAVQTHVTCEDATPEQFKYLLVWDKEGGCVSFPLSERPRITYDVAQATIHCVTSRQTVDFPLADVHKYTLAVEEPEQTSVDQAAIQHGNGKISQRSDQLLFENFKPGSVVQVFTLNGLLLQSLPVTAEGRLSVSIRAWAPGVYLVQAGSVTYKIIKR